ncbi:hypothetical protein [Capnocytophaga canis]|uniref:Uncharacterized protein n=1 Tax=Capnocytophaga canis TaxID=1848903 RepID=A0A0B7IT03_9FLAO|nr:hypothetical protein [Capnocytophaga canis]CEN53694.1 conserved exported hypothetical protein [Capnocytophaga canis]
MKNFAKTKNNCMFAVLFAKRQFYTFIVGAFFYAFTASVLANNIGYQTPLENCSTVKYGNCCLATTEGDSLSYIHLVTKNFRLKMPNNAKITNSVNNSNGIGTPYGAKSVISSTQSNVQGCNISGNIKYIKIINGISSNQLRNTLKSVLSEFIDNGFIDLKQSKL